MVLSALHPSQRTPNLEIKGPKTNPATQSADIAN